MEPGLNSNINETEKENKYLSEVLARLEVYKGEVEKRKSTVDKSVDYGLKHFNSDNAEQFTELTLNKNIQSQLSFKMSSLARSLLKPYFTRVDFTAGDEEGLKEFYIGKMPLLRDEDNYPLIIDWRAPVSNLYYEGRLGKAEYMSPDGLITGEISLKRQYIIENAKLLGFFDIDITANDSFLQTALGASKDKRLKDIVSTIQAEQNKVIRAGMVRPLVVQGAAGSGKTTIALHRIAYLLYHYEKRLSPSNIMILAPNKFFISYISEVLPDLGVENVIQTTWEDFAAAFLDGTLTIKPAIEKLAFIIKNPEYYNIISKVSYIKSSLRFLKTIDNYIETVIENLLPHKDFMLDNYTLITRKELNKLVCEDYSFLPISKRLPEIRKYLVNALKKAKPEILKEIHAQCGYSVESVKREMPEDSPLRRKRITEFFDERDKLISRIEYKSKSLVSGYLKNAGVLKPSEYYKNLVGNELIFKESAKGQINESDIPSIIKQTSKSINAGYYEEEDIAPLMHIHFRLYGNKYFDLRHIVIDEAQDISIFQLYVLREIMNSNSFSIFGDLRQGIFHYKGIYDWRLVTNSLFGGKAEYVTMAQSYRTTVEIMNFANITAQKLNFEINVPLAKPVIRHGEEVYCKAFNSEADLIDEIENTLSGFEQKGYSSIAVITKTLDECNRLHSHFKRQNITKLTGKEDSYGGGIIILPSYLSKGLEFDGVIISNSNAYIQSREIDIKLFYISMTRALHGLAVFSI